MKIKPLVWYNWGVFLVADGADKRYCITTWEDGKFALSLDDGEEEELFDTLEEAQRSAQEDYESYLKDFLED